ncbi:hypothetical protein J2Y67_000188 [Neobacillus niacini]|nr:hypothetical protein [Neobacillus niacini]
MVKILVKTLINQGFDANGHEAITEEDQPNDECYE